MALCTLCGCEVSFLTQKVIHLCSTEQPLCAECWKRYDRADEEEQPRIRERILASPHLRKREKVMEYLAENREAIARRDRARQKEKQRLDDLSIRMKTVLRCCDTPMEYLGQGKYPRRIVDGTIRTSTGRLAGSASDLYRDVCKAIEFGIPREDAFYMASTAPAQYMGLNKGRIETGYDADFIAIDAENNIHTVVIGGEIFTA